MILFIGEVKKETGKRSHDNLHDVIEPFVQVDERIVFPRPANLSVTLTNCGSEILVEGTLRVEAIISCSRCLEPFVYEIEGEICLELRNADRLVRTSQIEAEAQEDSDIRYYHEDDNYVDINREVRETAILNLPMKPICRPSCRGLCTLCGEDLNRSKCGCRKTVIDSRLSKLQNWRQNEK
ncbi:MAG TPA: DUF177 domain-containing protein [Atribacteraceae bacterium]|nr:DUF177 domain-containing protein [Atribacteraceae bacterium]